MTLSKKELAQKRNYFKYVLAGMHKPIDLRALNVYEIELWSEIQHKISLLTTNFNVSSQQLGLNVPERCWCGKIAKWKAKYDHQGLVCKKHIDD